MTMLMLALAAALAAPGCGGKKTSAAKRAYTGRGEIVRLPAAGEVYIRHEAMPEFVNAFGEQSGMMSMSMGFAIEAVPMDGVAIGDKVEIDFVTDWDLKPALRLTALRTLPPETELRF
jgi:hypothetical protein